jgi:hypothetical protein
MVTRAAPGTHGASTGWHGCGVRTPPTALVAAATCGLDRDMHSPNDGRLSVVKSVTTPAGAPADTRAADAVNVAGVVPNEHCTVAPVLTTVVMTAPP